MAKTYVKEIIHKEGQLVCLQGWVFRRRDHGGVMFIDLRDSTGIVQVVFSQDDYPEVFDQAQKLKSETVVEIKGKVCRRSERYVNTDLETGEFEIVAESLSVLGNSLDLPFPIDTDGYDLEESLRLKYRYLDLRRPRMQKNLWLRFQMMLKVRQFLAEKGFIEIETPILTKSTPEGARDFIVPSRLQPGEFYALPQSPQQYKQLLMVSGFERYFQIARCFRDEDPRADRCYGEFTQLDLEMSFMNQEDILNLAEEMMILVAEEVFHKKIWKKPFPRFTYAESMEKFGADKFDLRSESDPEVMAFAWVLDFPLFEKTETREISSSHHPFTAPHPEDIPLLDKDPMKVRSWQHDLVCNGMEVGGGSLRITDPEIQKKVFEILGHSQEEIEVKFGHLLEAFQYGVPPHGGIAFGVERVLSAGRNEPSVRELMSFPASSGGRTAVMSAPSGVSDDQLKELHIRVDREND